MGALTCRKFSGKFLVGTFPLRSRSFPNTVCNESAFLLRVVELVLFLSPIFVFFTAFCTISTFKVNKNKEEERAIKEWAEKLPGADLSGYFPLRGDFDVEHDNSAEEVGGYRPCSLSRGA